MQVEEIIVTADKARGFGASLVQVGTFRNARILDVPLAVNVVPRELLDAQAAQGLYDALRNTAGVTRSQLAGSTYDNIAIRGILVENRTSYRLNGSLPIINLVDLPLENKARVEVLKGVGALYYGFAPPSGIINMTTKRPDTDLGWVQLRGNLHGAYGGTMDVSRRFGGFGVRVNAAADNVDLGIDRFGGHRYVGALAADWEVSDAIRLKLDLEHVRKNVTETPAVVLPAAVGGVIAVPQPPKPETNLGDRWLRYDAHATNAMLRADVRVSQNLALTLEGGQALTVRDRDFAQFAFLPGRADGEGVLQLFQTRGQRYRNRNLRGEVATSVDAGPIDTQVVVGVTQNWRFQNGRSNQTSPAGLATGAVTQNYFTPRALAVVPVTATLTTAPLNISDFGAYAFSRSDLSAGERTVAQLLLGVRYSDYRSNARSAAGVLTRYTTEAWTPSVGVVLKPVENISVYGTYLEGLEEGGTAPANAANANEVLPPARSRQYEVGAKAQLGGLLLQGAWFQVTRANPFTDPVDRVFKLAGRARYRGFEASATGELTPQLSLYGSMQLLDAEFTSALNPLQLGRRPENTPKFTGSLYAEWRPPFVPGLALGGGVFAIGNRAVNALNQAFVEGYSLYSASVRYTVAGVGAEGLTVQVTGDNLGNARVWTAAGNGLLGASTPRQVKLSASIGF